MLLTLIWLIAAAAICWTYGLITYKLFMREMPANPVLPLLVGFPVLGFISQWLVIGGPVDFFSLVVVVLGSLTGYWRYQKLFHNELKRLWLSVRGEQPWMLWVFAGLFLMVAYQSALPTRINDMGMYYLQTMQWMNHYGMVKGLGNIHPAYALGSAWHSLTALLRDPWPYAEYGHPVFHGTNGLLLLSFALWTYAEWKQKTSGYLLGITLLILPFGFLYLTAPSPDFPLMVYTALCSFGIIQILASKEEQSDFSPGIILFFALFAFLCKPPALLAVATGAFAAIWWLLLNSINDNKDQIDIPVRSKPALSGVEGRNKLMALFSVPERSRKALSIVFIISLALIPLLTRNYYQTGYPLYPSPAKVPGIVEKIIPGLSTNPEWQIPADWNEVYRKGIITWGLNDRQDKAVVKEALPNTAERLQIWLKRPGYKGWMNRLLALNMLLGLGAIIILRNNKHRLFLLALISLQTLEWFFLSQYRLMLPTGIVLFGMNLTSFAFLGSSFTRLNAMKSHLIPMLLVFYTWLFVVLSIFSFSFMTSSSRNKRITQTSGFSADNLVLPYSNYRTGKPETFVVDSITFHSFTNRAYAWDAPIPAISRSHRAYLHDLLNYRVSALGNKVEDGFKMVRDTMENPESIRQLAD